MSTYKNVIEWNKALTSLIKQHTTNSAPTGLHEAINLIESLISEQSIKRGRYLASVRNSLIHEDSNNEIPVDYDFIASTFKGELISQLNISQVIVDSISYPDAAKHTDGMQGVCSNIVGTYKGNCLNHTYGGTADIILTIYSVENGKVEGHMQILGELVGTANARGVLRDNRITIQTDSGEGMPMSWLGIIEGNKIYGDYHVSVVVKLKNQGVKNQYGVWNVMKI